MTLSSVELAISRETPLRTARVAKRFVTPRRLSTVESYVF